MLVAKQKISYKRSRGHDDFDLNSTIARSFMTKKPYRKPRLKKLGLLRLVTHEDGEPDGSF